jgi:hypothetical protein
MGDVPGALSAVAKRVRPAVGFKSMIGARAIHDQPATQPLTLAEPLVML